MFDMCFTRLIFISLLAAFVLIGVPRAAKAQCPAFPKVNLWGDFSHKSVTRFVESKMKGDWDTYVARLKVLRSQLQTFYDQGKRVKIKLKNQQVTLSGEKLHDYLKFTEKRVKIVGCLAGQAKGKEPGAKAIDVSKPEGRDWDVDPQQKPNVPIKENPTAGLAHSVICVDCHGEHGVSDDPLTPNLAGQKASYLAKQLMSMRNTARDRAGIQDLDDLKRREAMKKFKSIFRNERSAEFMDDAVIGLSDQQIFDLGAYYSTQSCGQSTAVNTMSVRPLVGDACIKCHGEKGITKQARIPNIAGQHFTYLRDQLIAFKLAGLEAKTGTKIITRNKSMALQVADLRIVEIEDIATYFAALPCQ